jgi:hypothetical protein
MSSRFHFSGSPWKAIARWIVGGVFIAASVHKIYDPDAFALSIHRYQVVPSDLINLMAIYLPWLELLAGLALILAPRWRRGSIVILSALLVVFTLAIGLNIARGINVACGCFSSNPGAMHTNWLAILRNASLMGLSAVACRDAFRAPRPPEAAGE